MRLRSAIAALVVALAALPAAARAQTPAQAEADRLIASTGSPELFANVTTGDMPAVRHLRSGLVCRFESESTGRAVRLYALEAMAPGDGVSCGWTVAGVTTTLFGARYNDPSMTPTRALGDSLLAIRDAWLDLRPYEGQMVAIDPDDRWDDPAGTLTASVLFRDKAGTQLFSQVVTGRIGDWNFKLRATGAAADAVAVQRRSAGLWTRTIDEVAGRPGRN